MSDPIDFYGWNVQFNPRSAIYKIVRLPRLRHEREIPCIRRLLILEYGPVRQLLSLRREKSAIIFRFLPIFERLVFVDKLHINVQRRRLLLLVIWTISWSGCALRMGQHLGPMDLISRERAGDAAFVLLLRICRSTHWRGSLIVGFPVRIIRSLWHTTTGTRTSRPFYLT